jgi:hypothetical protein
MAADMDELDLFNPDDDEPANPAPGEDTASVLAYVAETIKLMLEVCTKQLVFLDRALERRSSTLFSFGCALQPLYTCHFLSIWT